LTGGPLQKSPVRTHAVLAGNTMSRSFSAELWAGNILPATDSESLLPYRTGAQTSGAFQPQIAASGSPLPAQLLFPDSWSGSTRFWDNPAAWSKPAQTDRTPCSGEHPSTSRGLCLQPACTIPRIFIRRSWLQTR